MASKDNLIERWAFGQRVTRREILGFDPTGTADTTQSWHGRSWLDIEARVVLDDADELVLYVPRGAPIDFPQHRWPSSDGLHPWAGLSGWQGPGCLMWHRPGEHHAVWHFWDDPDRTFRYWYVNLQTAYRRADTTFETQDLELDFIVHPDQRWEIKDWDAVDTRVAEGRYSPEAAAWIHSYGKTLIERLEDQDVWWPQHWADWQPPADWE